MPMKPVLSSQATNRGRALMGRPRKELTGDLLDELCGYLEEGNGLKIAADLVGISPITVRKWIKEGSADLAADRDTKQAESTLRIKHSMAAAKQLRINQLNNAADNPAFWAAAAWWLERTYPNEFGRQDRINMNVQSTAIVGIVPGRLDVSEDERTTILGLLGRLNSEDEGNDSDPGAFGIEDGSEDFDLSVS
jgi:hypothetical protein